MKIRLLLLTASLATTAFAKVEGEIKPAFLKSEDSNERAAGVRFELKADSRDERSAQSTHFSASTKGALATTAEANSENLTAEVAATIDRRIGGLVKINPSAPINPNEPPPPIGPAPWGFLASADVRIGFETDQRFNNSQLLLGPRLGLVHTERTGFRALAPSVFVSYDRVKVFESELLSSLGVTQRTFWRLEVDASWVWSPFERTDRAKDALTPLSLHADVRYFRSDDVPTAVKVRNQDDNLYTAVSLNYNTHALGWSRIEGFYVTVAHGRLPPSTREDTTIYLGVVVWKR
jgi:hypothetical protein